MSENTEPTTEETAVEQYPLKHVGNGRYRIVGDRDDTLYANKEEAQAARLHLIEQDELEEDFGDILPPGIKIRDRSLQFRGSMLEVPMNEPYLPNGDRNPMYDRAWVYGWAAFNGTSIADHQSNGYEIVRHSDIKKLVEDGKCPEHYLSLLRREGEYLHYGDLVLMKIPRIYWREQQAEKRNKAMEQFKKIQEKNNAQADRANIPVVDAGHRANEVTIRL